MRNIAFGYSTRCNIRCAHCVAADNSPAPQKMELARAKDIIREMAASGVTGISFTAGEPFLYLDDILELVDLCRVFGIYTRIVTNSFWATSPDRAGERLESLRQSGLCQLRLSSSRWHQQHVPLGNIANAARACEQTGMAYFISFVTDFSEEDDAHEQFFRDHGLKFFPEPLMYAGRAEPLNRNPLRTDYQDNRCAMNPYLAPDLNLYACCDAGSHFETTRSGSSWTAANATRSTIASVPWALPRLPPLPVSRGATSSPTANASSAKSCLTRRKRWQCFN
jgi:organic radical activating enzyme